MTAPQTYAADTLRQPAPAHTGAASAETLPATNPVPEPVPSTATAPGAIATHAAATGGANLSAQQEDPATDVQDAPLPPVAETTEAAFGPADSLCRDSVCAPQPYRDVTAQEIFGARSMTVSVERLPVAPAETLTDNAVFQCFVLLLAFTYALLLHRHLADARLLLGRISRDAASGKRLSEEQGGSGFTRFLNITASVGMLFLGVVAVKYGDSLASLRMLDSLSHAAVVAMSLLATAACTAIVGYQTALLRAAGAVTLSQPLVARILLLRRTYFALAVVVVSPALLLFALCPRGTGGVWFIVVAAALITIALLYLWETVNLFISKKISILHWFLYLCTIEIFPISLLWLLATR